MIYRALKRYSQGHPAVDMALIRNVRGGTQVLLGKRSASDAYARFPGGFFDPEQDASYEEAAARELLEETSVRVESSAAAYVGSRTVDDWRYADSKDRIATALFVFKYRDGIPAAADDLGHVAWYPVASIRDVIWKGHLPLANMLTAYLAKKT